jgi:hypothetical protein
MKNRLPLNASKNYMMQVTGGVFSGFSQHIQSVIPKRTLLPFICLWMS